MWTNDLNCIFLKIIYRNPDMRCFTMLEKLLTKKYKLSVKWFQGMLSLILEMFKNKFREI